MNDDEAVIAGSDDVGEVINVEVPITSRMLIEI